MVPLTMEVYVLQGFWSYHTLVSVAAIVALVAVLSFIMDSYERYRKSGLTATERFALLLRECTLGILVLGLFAAIYQFNGVAVVTPGTLLIAIITALAVLVTGVMSLAASVKASLDAKRASIEIEILKEELPVFSPTFDPVRQDTERQWGRRAQRDFGKLR